MFPRFELRDNTLSIDTRLCDMRLQWDEWPKAEELLRACRARWTEFLPPYRLMWPAGTPTPIERGLLAPDPAGSAAQEEEAAERRANAFLAFRAVIPERIAAAVESFTSHQWALLKLCGGNGSMLELTESNPSLAFALANNQLFRKSWPEAAGVLAAKYSWKRQRETMAFLGFPGEETAVKLMKKIAPVSATIPELLSLRRAISRIGPAAIRCMAHLQMVNHGVMVIVRDDSLRSLAAPALLAEVSNSPQETRDSPTADLLTHVRWLHGALGRRGALPVFASIDHVRRFHGELEAEATGVVAQRYHSPGPLPLPPIPGTRDIVPITTGRGLQKEATEQKHCVWMYEREIRTSGRCYVYKIMRPERATLMIRRGTDGKWRACELRLARNADVQPETRELVERWLAGCDSARQPAHCRRARVGRDKAPPPALGP